jgi:HSP20 family protein
MTNFVKVRPYPTTKSFTNGLLNEFLHRGVADHVGSDAVLSQPSTNVLETLDSFRIELAAPGFEKKDFSLHVENDHLVIEAKREEKNEEKNEDRPRFLRQEFRYESFKRSFKLPKSVNIEDIGAAYESGILSVVVPKKEEAKPLTKQIVIG